MTLHRMTISSSVKHLEYITFGCERCGQQLSVLSEMDSKFQSSASAYFTVTSPDETALRIVKGIRSAFQTH